MIMFAVVEFVGEKSVAVVPTTWLSGDQQVCFWPPFNAVKCTRAVIEQAEPCNDWDLFTVRCLTITDKYIDAREKCVRAEDTSDIGSEVEAARKKKPTSRYTAEEDTPPKRHKFASNHVISDDGDDDDDDEHRATQFSTMTPQRTLPAPPPPPPPTTNRRLSMSMFTSPTLQSPAPQEDRVRSLATPLSRPLAPSSHSAAAQGRVRCTTQPSRLLAPSLQSPAPQEDRVRSFATPSSRPLAVDPYLVSSIEEMKDQLRVLTGMVMGLANGPVDDTMLPDNLVLPAQTVQQVLDIDSCASDVIERRKMVTVLGRVGGANVAEATRRVMARLLAKSAALNFNFEGKGGKQPFKACHSLLGVIKEAVRKSQSGALDSEVEDTVKVWLRSGKDREGGRRRRQLQAANRENAIP